MPELPEVETVKRGLISHIEGKTIQAILVRQAQLRWPVPTVLSTLKNQHIKGLTRRGKYLLLQMTSGTLLIHLGMSGHLRIVPIDLPIKKHDHIDLILSDNTCLRYHDPRRFGAFLWTTEDALQHPLILTMGIEPLEESFTGLYVFQQAKNRRTAIKSFLMNSKMVAGIGNIYATEALFLAGIHPLLPANRLSLEQCNRLVEHIKSILIQAIAQGGTTLKDFKNSEGKPGYFSQKLYVYGRANLPCLVCKRPLKNIVISQRSTVFCAHCQDNFLDPHLA